MPAILNWTDVGSRWRAVVKLMKRLLEMQTTEANNVVTLRENLMTAFNASADRAVEAQIYGLIETGQNNINSFKGSILPFFGGYLLEIADALKLPDNQRPDNIIIDRIIDEMLGDAETVLKNTVGVSSAADADNIGDGSLYLNKADWEDIDNEFIIPDQITVECFADNAVSGTPKGDEQFKVDGEPDKGSLTHLTRGSGSNGGLQNTTSLGVTRVQNGTFEDFQPTNTPTGWTVDSGVVGTNILETIDAFHGEKALELIDVAGATTIALRQDKTSGSNRLDGRQKYCITVRVKTAGMTVGNIKFQLLGTGFVTLTPIDINTVYPATYTEYQAWFNIGKTVQDDLRLRIEVTGADAGASIKIDDLAIVKPVYHNGIGFVITRGASDWALNDRFLVTATNTESGNIQSFFGRYYGRKLPSAAVPTISDVL